MMIKACFAAAAATLVGFATAGPVNVFNNCNVTLYLQSVAWAGGQSGSLTEVPPNSSFTEDFRLSGSTIKISKLRSLDSPLFLGYSFSKVFDFAYYELGTEFGNPFADKHNVLSPGTGCVGFDCAADQPDCYSTPAVKKVYGCPLPVTLNATLCAA